MREQADLPVYGPEPPDDGRRVPVPSPAPALGSGDPRLSPRGDDRRRRRIERGIDRAGRVPFAVLPWVGVVLGLIWWPLLSVGVWWLVGSFRRGHRGILAAAVALLLVGAFQLINALLGRPFM